MLSEPSRTVSNLVLQLLKKPLATDESCERNIAALIDSELRHHVANPEELHHPAKLHPWLGNVYEALTALVDRPTDRQAMNKLDKIGAELDPAVALFAPLLAAADEKAASLGKAAADKDARLLQQQDQIAGLSSASAALQNSVTELKTTVAAQAEHAANLGRTIDAYRIQSDTYKTQIDTLSALVEEIFQSTGWRLLAPLRWYGRQRARLRKSRRRK